PSDELCRHFSRNRLSLYITVWPISTSLCQSRRHTTHSQSLSRVAIPPFLFTWGKGGGCTVKLKILLLETFWTCSPAKPNFHLQVDSRFQGKQRRERT